MTKWVSAMHPSYAAHFFCVATDLSSTNTRWKPMSSRRRVVFVVTAVSETFFQLS